MLKLTAETLAGETIELIMDEVGDTSPDDTVIIRGIACRLSSLRVASDCKECNEPEPPRGDGPRGRKTNCKCAPLSTR